MPSDPDNRMDELLKSYAKKRLDEAGAPAEMHPATRRLLQAEIAKLRPEPSTPVVPWWQNLLMIWPRLAFASGVFMVLCVATWSWMDSTKRSGSESQLAKHEPAVAEKAATFAEEREALRDDKSRVAEPVQLTKETDLRSRLVEDQVTTGDGIGVRGADALSKQKKAEPGKAEELAAVGRSYRSIAPSAPVVPLPAVNKPATLADQEVRRLGVADATPPQFTVTIAPRPADVRSKDAGNVASVIASTDALGKNLVANQETKLGPAPSSPSLNGRDGSLSFAANGQFNSVIATNAVIANADGLDALTLKNNNARLPGGVLPPTDGPAQQPVGNAASSLDAFYAANQNKSAAGAEASKLQLSLNDNDKSGQALANDREVLLRRNNSDPRATAAANRSLAPATQLPVAEGKSDQVALAGGKIATDKAARELNETAARADNNSYANLGVVAGQAIQNTALYRQRFALVPSVGQGTVFKKVSAAAATKVLSNFEVQRNGGQVRVVDADGSVYDGQVVTNTATVAGYLAATTDETRQQVRRSESRPAQAPAVQQANSYDADSQNWAFRVSGTNRTLRQNVSLEGVMQVGRYQNLAGQSQIVNANNQALGRAAATPRQQAQSTRLAGQNSGPADAYNQQISNTSQLSANLSNVYGAQRIQGQLRVGPANQVRLEAVPADN